eukprot:3188947-Prymnesium_polylepis.1
MARCREYRWARVTCNAQRFPRAVYIMNWGIKGKPDKRTAHHPCRRPYDFASLTRPQIAGAGHTCMTVSQCCTPHRRSCHDQGLPDRSAGLGRKAAAWVNLDP